MSASPGLDGARSSAASGLTAAGVAAGEDGDALLLAPLSQESTPSLVARRVREAIGAGLIAPGSQIGEADLARRLGVSRGPLREGLQRLTQEGLLVSYRNRGLFLIEMTPENVHDMYVARQAIEQAAIAVILRGGHQAAVAARLDAEVDRMVAAARSGDDGAVGEYDVRFHERLVEGSGSPRLIRMHQTLLTETRLCIRALRTAYEAPDERVAEHREIAAAVRSGDLARADRAIVEHMRDALERLTGDPHG